MDYIKKPMAIETESFRIIGEEAADKLARFNEDELAIVKRIIHTTADFEYADLVEFHPKAIEVCKQLFSNGGCKIYTDTTMIIHGVNRKKEKLGIELVNFVHDEDIYARSEKEGITRSMAAIEKAIDDDAIKIFAIGNAPTALFKLKELIEKGHKKPDLIIGVPVGFVGAAESKEILSDMGVPYIRINGRKGGSPVAATIINAIMKLV